MKTHQEIHDAIQITQVEATAATLSRILDILEALNERINDLQMAHNYLFNKAVDGFVVNELQRRTDEEKEEA